MDFHFSALGKNPRFGLVVGATAGQALQFGNPIRGLFFCLTKATIAAHGAKEYNVFLLRQQIQSN